MKNNEFSKSSLAKFVIVIWTLASFYLLYYSYQHQLGSTFISGWEMYKILIIKTPIAAAIILIFISVLILFKRLIGGQKAICRGDFARLPKILFIIAGSGFMLGGLFVIIFILIILPFLFLKQEIILGKPENISTLKFLAMLATLIGGGFLFLLRKYCRFLYGLLETSSALVVAIFQVDQTRASSVDLINPVYLISFLTAALYLTVRGLDNIDVALKAKPSDPSLKFWRRWLNV